MLQYLTELTPNRVKCKWTYVKHKAFEDIKRTVAHNNLSDYPDFNAQFYIYTDARNFQLGVFII